MSPRPVTVAVLASVVAFTAAVGAVVLAVFEAFMMEEEDL